MSFHVSELSRVRDGALASDASYGNNGAFSMTSPEPGWLLFLIASDGGAWEHVSVHAARRIGGQQRTPTWKEMVYVKDLFWDAEDVVMQLHPKRSAYVNNHPNVLHLWRPIGVEIPQPPSIMVGILQEAG